MSWTRRARGLPVRDGLLLAEASILLAAARLSIALLPFDRVASLCGLSPADPVPETGPASPRAERVGWAVRAMSSRTPWSNPCLTQALAGFLMLRRRRLPGVICLGVEKRNTVRAHAWLRSGDAILTGEAGRLGHVPIADLTGRA